MTRREFLMLLPAAAAVARSGGGISIPVRVIIDSKVNWRPGSLRRFWFGLWPEAVRCFAHCGIRLDLTSAVGEVERPPGREPVISGLDRAALNVVVTNRIPMQWDSGRSICGVTALYRGYHLSMIALSRAHGNQVPFLSLNTLVHEMLHALLQDIFDNRPGGVAGQAREFRVDAYATCLWLGGGCDAIRQSARRYLERLKAGATAT